VTAPIITPDTQSLTPARAELARINAEIAVRRVENEDARKLVDVWRGPTSELATVEAQLAAQREQRDAARDEWNAQGCPGDPPVEPTDLISLERARARLRDRLDANEAVVAAAVGRAERAQHLLAELEADQGSAHLRGAVEAVKERLDTHAIPALITFLGELATAQSISTVLEERRDPAATSASRAIDEAIILTRRSYAVRGDLDAARRFLGVLLADPSARIPDPAELIVERVDAGIPRSGVEDGTRWLNRGTEPLPSPYCASGADPAARMPARLEPAVAPLNGGASANAAAR